MVTLLLETNVSSRGPEAIGPLRAIACSAGQIAENDETVDNDEKPALRAIERAQLLPATSTLAF